MGSAAIISLPQYTIYREAKAILRKQYNHRLSLNDTWLEDLKLFSVVERDQQLDALYQRAVAA